MKRYGNIELEGNQLENSLFENLSSAPSTATGRVYFNTTDAVVQVHDGSGWVDLNSPDDDFYNNLANEGTPDGSDSILIYDDSAAGYKRQTRDNFFSDITGYLPSPVAPAGDNRYIQFNDNGDFGAQINFQWTSTDILWLAKSHTFTFSETTLIGDPGIIIQNPYATATSNKYAALSFHCRYDITYNNYGAIVLSNPTDSSYVSRFNFQVADDAGDISTPLYIDGQDGVVANKKFYATADLDVEDYLRVYRGTSGDALHLRGLSTDLVFNVDTGTAKWEIWSELGQTGNHYMTFVSGVTYIEGTFYLPGINTSGDTTTLRYNTGTGHVTYPTSDRRLKSNIKDPEIDALTVLRSFGPKQFHWSRENGREYLGWIAQEGKRYIPDMFPKIMQTGMYGISEFEILPYFHLVIVQTEDRVTQLEGEVAELKKKLNEALR